MITKFDVGEEIKCEVKAKICSIRINEDGKATYRIMLDDKIFGPLDDFIINEEKLCGITVSNKEW